MRNVKEVLTTSESLLALSMIVLFSLMVFGCGSTESSGDDMSLDASDELTEDGQDDQNEDIEPDAEPDVTDLDANDSTDQVEDTGEDGADTTDAEEDVEPIGSAGCVNGSSLPEGENTLMVEGRNRRFILRLPNGYTGEKAWPLVMALHGNGSSADYWDSTSGDRNIREVLQDDAVLIIAEAIDNQWRDYSQDSSTWPARIEEELIYFDDVLTMATSELCINEGAIFAMGFSGGGSFSGVLGCRRTDIRAIAVGGSVIYFDEENCIGTPAAWITIGTEELSSGREAYRDFFRDRAGCMESSVPTNPDPCVAYEGCGTETPVHYCQHPGDHFWPDFGSQAMWNFFAQFVEP